MVRGSGWFTGCLLAGVSLFLVSAASALADVAEARPLVAAALEKLDATNLDDDWYFTLQVTEGDEVRIVHSDPGRSKYKRRELITVNGVPPTQQELEKFQEQEVERIDGEDPDSSGYRHLVDSDTLQLIESGDGYLRLGFAPRIKALEKSRDELRGTLLFNTATQQIDEIEILNTAPLSPAFSVEVETYRLMLRFQPEQAEQLLNTLESHAVGSVGFVKSFESLVKVSFGEFRRAER